MFFQYNDYIENYKEAAYYSQLSEKIKEQIALQTNSEKLLKITNTYQNTLKDKEVKAQQERFYIYTGAGILFLILVFISVIRFRDIKLKHRQQVEKNTLLKEQYDEKVNSMNHLQNIYRNLTIDWVNIDNEVELLAQEYRVNEKPSIYSRIQELIDNIRKNADDQFIVWTKDLLGGDNTDNIYNNFTKKELILTGLCYSKYSKEDISLLMDIPLQRVHPSKLNLKHKLKQSGLDDDKIDSILFYD